MYGTDSEQSGDWPETPLDVLDGHYTWLQEQKTARAEAKRLMNMGVSEYRDEDSITTSLTRDGEMSLSVLPVLADGRLLDGTRLTDLDERDRPEALLLNTVPVPASWGKLLTAFDKDDDGRIELLVDAAENGIWMDEESTFGYSATLGLEKESDRVEDPAAQPPR